MNIFIEKNPKQIVDPKWSSKYSQNLSTSINRWPIRHYSHSSKFYNTPTTRRSHNCDSLLKQQISSMTLNIETEKYNNHKLKSLVDFCSTSKVKYTPLYGSSFDSLTGLKCSIPSLGLLPVISRPTTRAVILHGKRYTVFSLDDESDKKNEDKRYLKTENKSEQMIRFNESEQNKISLKMYRESSDLSEYGLSRTYCLSGRRMLEKRSPQIGNLQPTLNLHSMARREEEISGNYHPYENDSRRNCLLNDLDNTQMHRNANNEFFNSLEITPSGRAEIEADMISSRATNAIKRAINNRTKIDINFPEFERAKKRLLGMLLDQISEVKQCSKNLTISEISTMDEFWRFLQPKDNHRTEDSVLIRILEKRIGFDILEKEDTVTFMTKMFNNSTSEFEINYWSKIFLLLKIRTIDSVLLTKITIMIRLFRCQTQEEQVPSGLSLLATYFWIHLFKMLFGGGDEIRLTLSNYLETLLTIIVSNNDLDEDALRSIKEQLELMVTADTHIIEMIRSECRGNVEAIPLSIIHFIDIIPWVFAIHNDVFHRQWSIDDLAKVLGSLNIIGEE